MKVEYANPFIQSAIKVFEQEIRIKLTRQELKKKTSAVPSFPVSIIIGVTGPIRGQVVYSMDNNFAFNVTKAMIPNKLPAETRKLVNSAVSEIANIITGQASIEMAGEDKAISITPPAVLRGDNVRVDFISIPTISISFISEIGLLEVNIALTEQA